jgi:hypothetical protein
MVKVQMKVHSSPMIEWIELGNPKPYYNGPIPHQHGLIFETHEYKWVTCAKHSTWSKDKSFLHSNTITNYQPHVEGKMSTTFFIIVKQMLKLKHGVFTLNFPIVMTIILLFKTQLHMLFHLSHALWKDLCMFTLPYGQI